MSIQHFRVAPCPLLRHFAFLFLLTQKTLVKGKDAEDQLSIEWVTSNRGIQQR